MLNGRTSTGADMPGVTATNWRSVCRACRFAHVRADDLFNGCVRQPLLIALRSCCSPTRRAGRSRSARKWEGAPEAIFELSSKQKCSTSCSRLSVGCLPRHHPAERAEMDRQYSGFTFFKNHMGAFRPPSSASFDDDGSVYRNQERSQVIAKEFKRASIFGLCAIRGSVDACPG